AGDVSDREVDLPQKQHEDDAVGQHRRAGHLDDDVSEVDGGEEVRRLEPEEDDDRNLADDDRDDSEVPGAEIGADPLEEAGVLFRGVRFCCSRIDGLRGAHYDAPVVAGMPATFVGIPAVIAATTSCWVVFSRSNTPTFRPSRSTVIRFAVSKMS